MSWPIDGRRALTNLCVFFVCVGKVKGLKEDDDNIFWHNAGNGKPRSAPVLNDEGDGLRLLNKEGKVVVSGEGLKRIPLRFESIDVEGLSIFPVLMLLKANVKPPHS